MPIHDLLDMRESNFFRSDSSAMILWKGRENHQVLQALSEIRTIPHAQLLAILYRVSSMLSDFTGRCAVYSFAFHTGRTMVTIGSLVVPALLSIQGRGDADTALYWITWSISLVVTMCNGLLTLFKVEKKYNFLHAISEQLRSECWQYIHLTGKYSGHHHHRGKSSTHANELVYFTHALERIKLKQIDEDYWKNQQAHATHPDSSSKKHGLDPQSLAALFAPTPGEEELTVQASSRHLPRPTDVTIVDPRGSVHPMDVTIVETNMGVPPEEGNVGPEAEGDDESI